MRYVDDALRPRSDDCRECNPLGAADAQDTLTKTTSSADDGHVMGKWLAHNGFHDFAREAGGIIRAAQGIPRQHG